MTLYKKFNPQLSAFMLGENQVNFGYNLNVIVVLNLTFETEAGEVASCGLRITRLGAKGIVELYIKQLILGHK